MSDPVSVRSPDRPILLGVPDQPSTFNPAGGGSATVATPSASRQAERLDSRMKSLLDAFSTGAVALDVSLPVDDPELVVVFEVVDSQREVLTAAAALGIEILVEAEDETFPDTDFPRVDRNNQPTGSTVPVKTCLHAMCATRQAAVDLVSLWNRWLADGRLAAPYGGLANLFGHLRDVRSWGPNDRLRMQGVNDLLLGMLDDQRISVELELWYRNSAEARTAAQQRITVLVTAAAGTIGQTAVLPEIRYHGLAVELPVPAIRNLVAGDYDEVALIKASDVLYLRVAGQLVDDPVTEPIGLPPTPAEFPPVGDPAICLLDGVPAANHERLAGRISVWDPDDLGSRPLSTAANRRHGTAMASVLVWGDLNANDGPASRPILVRPILTASAATTTSTEELPEGVLVPDLMWRVFRELFEGVYGQPPVAPNAVILNLSVGDPAMPFDVMPSAWARAMDWLSDLYGVLVIVSAGNHPTLSVPGLSRTDLEALGGEDRRTVIRTAMRDQAAARRLLSPAESLNALTIGAIHSDQAGPVAVGYRIDPGDGANMVHPLSAIGRGQRRAVKPDLAAPGGRSYLTVRPNPSTILQPVPSPLGPGIKVAASSDAQPTNGASYVVGTSPAAALMSRQASRILDILQFIQGWPTAAERAQRAVTIKALLVHGASWPALETEPLQQDRVWGYGMIERDLTVGCAENEATVIFLGRLGANQEQRLPIPLPSGLQQVGIKEVTATLAWLSPINSGHRQYRRAKLALTKPQGLVPADRLKSQAVEARAAQRGTVQHQAYRTTRASTAGRGDPLALTVRCVEQAGGLAHRNIDYAVALSLRVAPELGIDVYNEVQAQLRVSTRARLSLAPSD